MMRKTEQPATAPNHAKSEILRLRARPRRLEEKCDIKRAARYFVE